MYIIIFLNSIHYILINNYILKEKKSNEKTISYLWREIKYTYYQAKIATNQIWLKRRNNVLPILSNCHLHFRMLGSVFLLFYFIPFLKQYIQKIQMNWWLPPIYIDYSFSRTMQWSNFRHGLDIKTKFWILFQMNFFGWFTTTYYFSISILFA